MMVICKKFSSFLDDFLGFFMILVWPLWPFVKLRRPVTRDRRIDLIGTVHEIPRTPARNPGLSELILYASANLPTWTAYLFPFPTPWIPYYPIPETCPWKWLVLSVPLLSHGMYEFFFLVHQRSVLKARLGPQFHQRKARNDHSFRTV